MRNLLAISLCKRRFICQHNVGIIAHIDAGKTTTTERMLYYAGIISQIGEVHQGNTVMDYLRAERERGITISSAAISFDWAGHRVNLIDTPGHVDFGVEVERSLRVVDAAITVIDAVAGVEVQTEQVWRQASSHSIPKAVFINKMDREGANVEKCLNDLREVLNASAVPINLPLMPNAVVDLVSGEKVEFGGRNGEKLRRIPLGIEEFAQERLELLEFLAERDDEFLEVFSHSILNPLATIPKVHIRDCLKRLTCNEVIVPVLFGAAYKNVGVQPLLDAIVELLPDSKRKNLSTSECVCFAFKVCIHPQKGPLVFVRVYSGTLTAQSIAFNSTRQLKERITKIYAPSADEFLAISCVPAGGIAVLAGLKRTRTGDTLVANVSSSSFVLPGISCGNSVFIQSIEPERQSDEAYLIECLDAIVLEDPSFHYSFDAEANQMLIHGIGELHLEIVADRLFREMKARGSVGEIRIAYKIAIKKGIQLKLNDISMDNGVFSNLCITFERSNELENSVEFSSSEIHTTTTTLDEKCKEEIKKSIQCALQRGAGSFTNEPIAFTEVTVHQMELLKEEVSLDFLSQECYKIICQFLDEVPASKTSAFERIEPFFSLEASIPTGCTGTIISDLNARGTLTSVNHLGESGFSLVRGKLPVSRSLGYSKWIRSATAGKVSFTLKYQGYQSKEDTEHEKNVNS